MQSQDKYFYPVTPATLHKYAEDIFVPIRRGECVTTVWVPMAGRRMWNKFIIENIHLFGKELPNYDKYLLVYIEPLDLTEETLSGYIRLMAQSFVEVALKNSYVNNKIIEDASDYFKDENASYSNLLHNLKKLLKEATDSGLEVVFFVGEFDELTFATTVFYNNLKSLWSQLYPRLHYAFLMRERVTRQANISKWGELNEAILQNIIYVPLRSAQDTGYLLDYFADQFSTEVTESKARLLKDLSGGHPYMLKVAVRFIAHTSKDTPTERVYDMLLNYYELLSVARGILDVRSDSEKKCLRFVAAGKSVPSELSEVLDFLTNLGLVKNGVNGTNILFSEIFNKVVQKPDSTQVETASFGDDLVLDRETGVVTVNGKTIEEKLTLQEHMILSAFLKLEDKLFSREEIGEILWGKESYEKYSDWAIDQLVSKLRKKLKMIGSKARLVTIRGRGYKLSLH